MENEILYWIKLKSDLMNCASSSNPFIRLMAKKHYLATEEVILTAKAMDFIEGLVR